MVEHLTYGLALSFLESRTRSLSEPRMSDLFLCNTIGSYSRQLLHNQHIKLTLEEAMNAA